MFIFKKRPKTESPKTESYSSSQEDPPNNEHRAPTAASASNYVPEWRMIYGGHLPSAPTGPDNTGDQHAAARPGAEDDLQAAK